MKTTKWSFFACLILSVFIIACNQSNEQVEAVDANPPAPGFNMDASDAKAVEIADEVMSAMGGRKAWDQTERLYWNFFGRRTLDWNKQKQTVKVHLLNDSTIIDLDLKTSTGTVEVKGEEIADEETVAQYLKQANGIWINDSYWLVMPYKLKDSGVTLKYVGRDTTAIGQQGDKLELTFENVGNTPQNKYEVIVTDEKRLVEEWRFYTNATDTVPRFITPWANYKEYEGILLSGDRGQFQLSDIEVGYPEKEN